MSSTDTSVEIAQSYGARVIEVDRVPIAEAVRHLALEHVKTDWILWIDPDERFPASYELEVPRLCATDASAFRLPVRDIAFGRPLNVVFAEGSKLVLMRTKDVVLPEPGVVPAHSEPKIRGRIEKADVEPIGHLSCRSVEQMLSKEFRYALSGGLANMHVSEVKPFTFLFMLMKELIVYRNWADGIEGLTYSQMVTIGEYGALLRLWETQGRPPMQITPMARRLLLSARWLILALSRLKQVKAKVSPNGS